jgi:hypothetical protein
MAAKHSASPTSYRAFFHGLGQIGSFVGGQADGSFALKPDRCATAWEAPASIVSGDSAKPQQWGGAGRTTLPGTPPSKTSWFRTGFITLLQPRGER